MNRLTPSGRSRARSRLVLATLLSIGLASLGWIVNTLFGWVIISDNTLNNVANLSSVVSLIVAILAAAWPLIERSYKPSSVATADLADDLAQNLLNEWLEEADAQQLRQPGVLPLTWSAADKITSDDKAILVRPGRLDGDFDAAATRLAQTYGTIPDGRLLVLGEPGAGKTVLAILLTLGLLQQRKHGGRVPMMLSLSTWDPSYVTLDDWITGKIADTHYGGSREIPRTLLQNDLLLPVLDGLDEIPEPSRAIAVSGINRSTGISRPVVLTCRRAEFEGVVKGGGPVLRHAALVQIRPLAALDVIDYLTQTPWPTGVTWEKVFAAIKDKPDSPIATVFHSPLMVSAARSAYEGGGGDPGELVAIDSRHDLENSILDRLVDAAYPIASPSPAGKGRAPAGQREQQWLTFLASSLYRRQEREIAWWRLSSGLLSDASGLALFIVGAATATIFSYILLALLGPASSGKLDRAFVATALGFVFTVLSTVSWQTGKTNLPGRLSCASRGSLRRFRVAFIRGAGLPWLITAVIIVAYPVIVALSDWQWSFESAQMYFVVSALMAGIGLMLGLGLAVHDWLTTPREDARRTDPVDLLRHDRTSAIVSSFVAGATVALLIIPVFVACVRVGGSLGEMTTGWPGSPTRLNLLFNLPMYDHNDTSTLSLRSAGPVMELSLLAGLAFTIVLLLSRAWTQFLLARVTLRAGGKLPLRLMRFLADAQRRQLLRQAGGVYQFRHVRLQERLVTRAAPLGVSINGGHEELGRRVRRLAARYGLAASASVASILAILASAAAIPKDQAGMVLKGCGRNSSVARIYSADNGVTMVGLTSDQLCFWHRDSPRPFAAAALPPRPIGFATLSQDGRTFEVVSKAGVSSWETGTGKLVRTMPFSTSVGNVTLSPEGDTAVTKGKVSPTTPRGREDLWDVASGKLVAAIPGLVGDANITYSPDGGRLAVYTATDPRLLVQVTSPAPASHPITIRLSKETTGQSGSPGAAIGVARVAFSPDGSLLAVVASKRVSLWNAETGGKIATLDLGGWDVSSLAFSADGRYLLAATNESVRVWATSEGKLSAELPGQYSTPVFSPDGRTIAIRYHAHTLPYGILSDDVMLWDFKANIRLPLALSSLPTPEWQFSSDGRFIAAWEKSDNYDFGAPEYVALFETTTGHKVATLKGHTGDVTDVTFSADKRQLVTSSTDGTVRLWRLPS